MNTKGGTGVILSPMYPVALPRQLNTIWYIPAYDYVLNLYFLTFNLSSGDAVRVFNGYGTNSKRVKR